MLIGKTFRNATLELSNQRIVKPVDVDNNYGQVVIAELFQRQNDAKPPKSSSSVPNPPLRATKASLRLSISCLRSCIVAV